MNDFRSKPKPKINDKFRFDDGTIGTVSAINITVRNMYPCIEVASKKFGYSTFAIASIEYFSGKNEAINYWRVIED